MRQEYWTISISQTVGAVPTIKLGNEIVLLAKSHDRKLPLWKAQCYHIIAYVYQELSVYMAARHLRCAKATACHCVKEFNQHGFRRFERSSNPEGRLTQLTAAYLTTLNQIAQKRPADVGLPFTNWSMTKLQDYLVKHHHFSLICPEWMC